MKARLAMLCSVALLTSRTTSLQRLIPHRRSEIVRSRRVVKQHSLVALVGVEPLLSVTSEVPSSLLPLGNDLMMFLFVTIGVVPLFKWLNASPVLGFLAAGLIMGPAGLHLFSDLGDMESLANFGVLFLLFEQGLELTVHRLAALSKYAFGMGTAQVVLSTLAFFAFPFLGGVPFLEYFVGSDASVVDITRLDEAAVIGAALSLSSSAFVLQILYEKGQLNSTFGPPALGILLLQDIAVVPLLVLLPVLESRTDGAVSASLLQQATLVGSTVLKAVAGLTGIAFLGGNIVRTMFAIVARSRSSETFVALCLLVVIGIGALTDHLGLSSTLGAFVAGTLLAESNYRQQIETDIRPFKGLLLGLFFLTTGASVDPYVIQQQWPTILALLLGLITFKTTIIALLGPRFGLSRADSVRVGLLLSGGGEFAFVVLTLADKLEVLPDLLVKMLVGVVVLSMALTPYLSALGDAIAARLEEDSEHRLSQAVEVPQSAEPAHLNAGSVRKPHDVRRRAAVLYAQSQRYLRLIGSSVLALGGDYVWRSDTERGGAPTSSAPPAPDHPRSGNESNTCESAETVSGTEPPLLGITLADEDQQRNELKRVNPITLSGADHSPSTK